MCVCVVVCAHNGGPGPSHLWRPRHTGGLLVHGRASRAVRVRSLCWGLCWRRVLRGFISGSAATQAPQHVSVGEDHTS